MDEVLETNVENIATPMATLVNLQLFLIETNEWLDITERAGQEDEGYGVAINPWYEVSLARENGEGIIASFYGQNPVGEDKNVFLYSTLNGDTQAELTGEEFLAKAYALHEAEKAEFDTQDLDED